MLSWNKSADRPVIVQMNAKLQDAQVELLSAHCATERIRLRFSTEDIAQHGRRDVLRKAFGAATALHDFYSSIEEQINQLETQQTPRKFEFGEQHILTGIESAIAYIREQRERYWPESLSLSEQHKRLLRPFFSDSILSRVKVVELKGRRVPMPSIFEDAKAQGFVNLPEPPHMTSLTFEDVLVFNDTITERSLFHALVLAVQFQVLGLQRFVEIFVRSFLKTHSYFNVTLKSHAFALESRFAANPTRSFPVEEYVHLWATQRRYEATDLIFNV
ncbi:MAG TPA: hypothetical protein VN684_02200 [Terriglobales bacterium]|nr:hypothetical protein [Terriglobales bacterium]